MVFPRFLMGAALTATLSMPLAAQQAQTGYHSIACVKVNTGKWAEIDQWVAGTERKLSQELVDSGKAQSMLVLQTQIPQGTRAECDYVFVTFFQGLPPEDLSPEEVTAALHKAGIPITAAQLYNKRTELGTLVYDNITQFQTLVGGAKKGDYLAFNSINAPDVAACVSYEQKVWQPVAEQMLKDGTSSGWALNEQIFPRGTKDKPLVSTVDLFPSWDAAFKEYDTIMDTWKKVHPDMDINSTMGQFGKLCAIEHTVLYKIADMVVPKK